MRVKIKSAIAAFPPECGKEGDRSVRGDILKEDSNSLGVCSEHIHMCRGRKCREQRSVASCDRSVPVAFYHHHAEGAAFSQPSSPFKGKTHPVAAASSDPHHTTSTGDHTFPRSKHESAVIGQNHVRRMQRSSKERSRVHSMREKPSTQAGLSPLLVRAVEMD